MKKLFIFLLIVLTAMLCTGCRKEWEDSKTLNSVPLIINKNEYILYRNVFHNNCGANYVGKTVKKTGVFSVLYDAYNHMTRYYLWGYLDFTKCCDWSWEIVPDDEASLPPVGSLIVMEGTFAESEDALDGYWIENAQITVQKTYIGKTAEVNMYTMGHTLERMQMTNIRFYSESFEGKTFLAYGRVTGLNTLEDPYYYGSWQMPFTSDSIPAIGHSVLVSGTIGEGMLLDCVFSANE